MSFATLLDPLAGAGAMLWRASWQASVVALLVLAVHAVVGGRIPPKWRHAMWMLVLVRLALPAVPRSPLSVFNLAPPARIGRTLAVDAAFDPPVTPPPTTLTDLPAPSPASSSRPLSSPSAIADRSADFGDSSNVLKNTRRAEAGALRASSEPGVSAQSDAPSSPSRSSSSSPSLFSSSSPIKTTPANPDRYSNVLENNRMTEADSGSPSRPDDATALGRRVGSAEGSSPQVVPVLVPAIASTSSLNPNLDSSGPTATRYLARSGDRTPWRAMLAAAWLAGVGLLASRVAWATVRVSRTLRGLERVDDPAVLELLRNTARELRIVRPPVLLTGERLFNPALAGCLRARLLLPRELLVRFDATELRLIFLHELAHLKRRDVATNWFATVLTILHWPNPVAWFVAWRLRVERELACDEIVLSHTPGGDADRRAYGETILKLLETYTSAARSPLPAGGVGILEGKHQMKRRITMIARFAKRSRTWAAFAALIVVGLGMVTLTDRVNAKPDAPTSRPSAGADDHRNDESARDDGFKSPSVSVTGSVESPNQYLLTSPSMSLAELINCAGGISGRPRDALVRVFRKTHPGDGKGTVAPVAEVPGNALEKQKEILMVAGDVVKVEPAAVQPAAVAPQTPAAVAAQPEDYKIAAGDQVQVTVYDLEGPGLQTIKNARVSASGEITLPYVKARIKVAGLTELQTQAAIAKAYKSEGVLDDANISVSVTEPRSPSTKPAVHAEIGGEELVTVSIMDLVGTGVETIKTSRVDAEGKIDLPYIGLVKAAGLKSVELEKAIAKTYHDQGIVDRALVVVSLPSRGESHSLSGKAAPLPPAAAGAQSTGPVEVRVYDVDDFLKGKDDATRNAVVVDILQVIKVCAGPQAGVSSFDEKVIVSAAPAEHESIARTLKALRDAPPGVESVKAKARAEAVKRATQLWRDDYLKRILVVGGQDNYWQVRGEFEKAVDAMGAGIKGSDVPTPRTREDDAPQAEPGQGRRAKPATRPKAGASVDDLSVDDIGELDPQMAKHLQIRQEAEVQLELIKRGGAAPSSARRKSIQDQIDVRDQLIDERAVWFREKYKDYRWVSGVLVPVVPLPK